MRRFFDYDFDGLSLLNAVPHLTLGKFEGADLFFKLADVNILAAPGNSRLEAQILSDTQRLTASSDGSPANSSHFSQAEMTYDGRYIAFVSSASNLVANDTNGTLDIFLYDRDTDSITRASNGIAGAEANGGSYYISIASGGAMVFTSNASNLTGGDTNGQPDVFLAFSGGASPSIISVGINGTQSNGGSFNASITDNTQFITYYSDATNLVAGDTNSNTDIFIYNSATNTTDRLIGNGGVQANGNSYDPEISSGFDVDMQAWGRFIVFRSDATNLVAGSDTNGTFDVFLYDRDTQNITRISEAADGAVGNNSSQDISISSDGRYITYSSSADNLVSGDSNSKEDIFLYDRETGVTELISMNEGVQSNGNSTSATISDDGRFITYDSDATNLVAGATSGVRQVYLHDRQTGETQLISALEDGTIGDDASEGAYISGNGSYVTYLSLADNLVSGPASTFQQIHYTALSNEILGTPNDDELIGADRNDIIRGLEGNDTLRGNDGNDVLYGGQGDDLLDGGRDQNELYGGAGNDSLVGGSDVDLLYGEDGDDYLLSGWGNDTLYGGAGNDTLSDDFGNSYLFGGEGDDTLTGSGGNDIIDGGDGIDIATYNADFSEVTITFNSDGTVTVSGARNIIDTDTLINVEFLRFDDGDFSLAAGGPAPTEGNDDILGSILADTIDALGGNDIVDGLGGDDIISGGDGNDRLLGNIGDDTLNGDSGADTLIGGAGADTLNGGVGFDTVDYRDAVQGVRFNVATGGTQGEALGDTFSGIERYYLSNLGDVVTGSSANEFFYGEDGNDQINGGGGIDRIYGGDGNDIQRGQDGNDTLYGSAGNDQLNGGAGFDIANYSLAGAAVIVNMLTGGTGGDAAGDSYFGIEAVYGSDFNDSLTGNNSANELRGGDGDDMLFGLGGNDRFFGGEGADSFDGGAGIDTVSYTNATEGITVFLFMPGTSGDADGDTFTSIEWVFGTSFSDVIFGDDGNNRLEGRDGNDQLFGREGNDRLLGGDGNDTIQGEEGVDTIFGQAGNDMLFGGDGNDFFFGGAGLDSHDGGAGIDSVSYLSSSIGLVIDMTGFLTTTGDAAGDTYTNIERIFGSGHDDTIIGDSGNQTLIGNGGDDFIWGGEGADSLSGGAGTDRFYYDGIFDGADVITDFRSGASSSEVIELAPTGINSFAALMAIASDAGANTIFDFGGGNTLTVVGSNMADFVADDFVLNAMPPASEMLDNSDAFAADVVDVFDMDALI